MLKIKVKSRRAIFKKKRDNCARRKIKKLLKYLRSELGSSTSHGLPYIVNTEIHWFERIFWTVNFVLAAVLIFVLLSAQYTRFMEQPIVMSVEKDYFNWNISYPSILLCPLNKIDEDLLIAFKNESRLATGQDLGSYMESIATVTLDTISVIQIPDPEIIHLLKSSDYAKLAAQVFKPFQNGSLTSKTNWPMSVEPVMTEMGMCHMINSNVAVYDNPNKWSFRDVTYRKNNIELSFHDQDFFIQIMNYADSYKIYIQGPDDITLYEVPAFTYDSEGFLTFGVQMFNTKSSLDLRTMSIKHRKCRFVEEPHTNRYPVYSYNRCLMECRIRMILKFCNCVPHFYKPLENERVCDLRELWCITDYLKDVLTLSTSNETMEEFGHSKDLPRSSRDCGCLSNCEFEMYQKDQGIFIPQEGLNRLKITVFAFPKFRILRERIFSYSDIILKSGGVVNLCIGASVISVMELIMTVIRIPIYEIVKLIHYILASKKLTKAWSKKNK